MFDYNGCCHESTVTSVQVAAVILMIKKGQQRKKEREGKNENVFFFLFKDWHEECFRRKSSKGKRSLRASKKRKTL